MQPIRPFKTECSQRKQAIAQQHAIETRAAVQQLRFGRRQPAMTYEAARDKSERVA